MEYGGYIEKVGNTSFTCKFFAYKWMKDSKDENGNVMHADSDDMFSESRTTKGKTLPSLGIFRAKGVYSFRPLVPKK